MNSPSEARHTALVVDDEADIRELLELTLSRMGVAAHTAETLADARAALQRQRFDLCLTDMRLPDGNGVELVAYLQENAPDLPVAVITAYGSMDAAVEALKAGAFDFVSKPVELEVLRNLVTTALRLAPDQPAPERRTRNVLIGDSPEMEAIRGKIAKLARSQAPIYISGESGTGKELVARLIHQRGPRAEGPFVPVNCGAIPADLVESELFGHRKGAFTGANADKEGLFQAAQGGTLFLDEVADLPMHIQVKLLRAIQEKAVRPIGAQKEVPVDVRILSATHTDLAELVREGRFREDLYYRLHVIELHVPALRDRQGDLPILVEHFLQRLTEDMGSPLPQLTAAATEALQAYPFPGNVRELENILERAVTLCEGDAITADDLGLPAATRDSGSPGPSSAEPLDIYLTNIEKEAILSALERTDQNKTAAAKALGISFRALRYRLKKLGLE